MSKDQTMPTQLREGPVPTVSADCWMAKVESLVGRQLGKVDRAYAVALAEHHNWTATLVADQIKLCDAAPALLAACKCLLADLEGAVELLSDDVPGCWLESIDEAQAAIVQADPPTFDAE